MNCVAYQFKAAIPACGTCGPPTPAVLAICKTFNTGDKLVQGDNDKGKGKCYVIPMNPDPSDVDGGLIGRCVTSTGSEIGAAYAYQHAKIKTLSDCLTACSNRFSLGV